MKKYPRLLFLDTMRGFMILYVVFIHGLSGIVFHNDPAALRNAPGWLLAVFAPLALLATWAPLFAFVSGAAHAYGFHKIIRGHMTSGGQHNGPPVKRFLAGGITTAVLLYLLSAMNMALVHHPMYFNNSYHYTLLTGSLMLGYCPDFPVELLFYNDALSMIAGCGLALDLLLVLLRYVGFTADTRRIILALSGASAAILILTPGLQRLLVGPFYLALHSGNYLHALAIKLLVGPNLALFPCLAFTLAGAALTFAVADGVALKIILRRGAWTAGLLVLAAVILFLTDGYAAEELARQPGPVKMQVLNLGLILGFALLLLRVMDLSPDPSQRTRWVSRTLWLRRAGIMALSIFFFESFVATAFSRLLLYLLKTETFPRTPWIAGLFLLFLVGFWMLVTLGFEKVQFKGTLEWMMAQIVGAVRGWGTRRLDAEVVLRPDSCLAGALPGRQARADAPGRGRSYADQPGGVLLPGHDDKKRHTSESVWD